MSMQTEIRFIIRTIAFTALIITWGKPASAQSQESGASALVSEEGQSAADASKQAANPLARAWLMQLQQNNSWVGMPSNKGDRVQSNLYFQPLLSVKVSDNWTLLSRPVLEIFNSAPCQDLTGQTRRVTGFGDMDLAFALSPGHCFGW